MRNREIIDYKSDPNWCGEEQEDAYIFGFIEIKYVTKEEFIEQYSDRLQEGKD